MAGSRRAGASRGRGPEGADGLRRVRADGGSRLATENMVPGNQVYKERLVTSGGVEYRVWDPFRSKLAAAVMNGLSDFPFRAGSVVLYLGASTGTTVSHLSDIVGPGGAIFAVEHASRVARDLLDRVAAHRPNVVPIMGDARRPQEYFSVHGKADVVYADIAQHDQTEIALANCGRFLRPAGFLFLVVKTRSIDSVRPAAGIVREEEGKLRAGFDVLQTINLYPYDKDHAMVTARSRG